MLSYDEAVAELNSVRTFIHESGDSIEIEVSDQTSFALTNNLNSPPIPDGGLIELLYSALFY